MRDAARVPPPRADSRRALRGHRARSPEQGAEDAGEQPRARREHRRPPRSATGSGAGGRQRETPRRRRRPTRTRSSRFLAQRSTTMRTLAEYRALSSGLTPLGHAGGGPRRRRDSSRSASASSSAAARLRRRNRPEQIVVRQHELTERILRLRGVPSFRKHDRDELAQLAASLRIGTFEKGDLLLREDEPPTAVLSAHDGNRDDAPHGQRIGTVAAPGGVGFLALLARVAGGTVAVAEAHTSRRFEVRADAIGRAVRGPLLGPARITSLGDRAPDPGGPKRRAAAYVAPVVVRQAALARASSASWSAFSSSVACARSSMRTSIRSRARA